MTTRSRLAVALRALADTATTAARSAAAHAEAEERRLRALGGG